MANFVVTSRAADGLVHGVSMAPVNLVTEFFISIGQIEFRCHERTIGICHISVPSITIEVHCAVMEPMEGYFLQILPSIHANGSTTKGGIYSVNAQRKDRYQWFIIEVCRRDFVRSILCNIPLACSYKSIYTINPASHYSSFRTQPFSSMIYDNIRWSMYVPLCCRWIHADL